jgi:LynF/TruF/PatF family peptide O-prenyltransferase
MITEANTLLDSNENLHYIGEHKRTFHVESLYPLDIFECFVKEVKGWGLECSCKIEKDKLYPARFNLFRNNPGFEEFDTVFDFFRQVEARDDVKLDYWLMQRFLGDDFDPNKITQILVGVDLRRELLASRVKFWLVIQDYPEKQETEIALGDPTEELRALIACTSLVVVGFDFFLDGSSTIELYPRIMSDELEAVEVRRLLAKFMSPPTLRLLENCWAFGFGFSKANPETVLYCPTPEPDSFISNLHNQLANRVHDYYRKQPIKATIVALRESELLAGAVQNLNLYYQMSLGVL